MVPQSLMLDTPAQGSGSSKRQRSADSRDAQIRSEATNDSMTSGITTHPSEGQLRANVKIPRFLEKSRAEISSSFQDLEWKQRFRLFHAMENPQTSPYRVDRSEIVIGRNRYGNVQPWDGSRIKLRTPMGGSDYVNASPINLRSRSFNPNHGGTSNSDHLPSTEYKYIASQGPKQGQYSHFWHMVHQETIGDTGAVIMLTQLYEANKEKCAAYFPLNWDNQVIELPLDETGKRPGKPSLGSSNNGEDPFFDNKSSSGTDESEEIGQATPESASPNPDSNGNEVLKPLDTVELVSLEQDKSIGCEIRKLKLTIGDEAKTIFHYLFKGWPDFGRPEAEERKALVELTRRSRQVAQRSPRIVHCSAGVGRTGTWIALDFLTHEIDEGRMIDMTSNQQQNEQAFNANVEASKRTPTREMETWGKSGPPKISTPTDDDLSPHAKDDDDLIYDTVNTLREQRMMMVMNELQFLFLYETVREVFLDKYQAKPEGAVVRVGMTASTDPETAPPRSKVPKTEGVDGVTSDESPSEAETEIMTDVETVKKAEKKMKQSDEDPYAAVAPQGIQGVMNRGQ